MLSSCLQESPCLIALLFFLCMFVFSDVKHFVLSIVYVLSCVVGYDFSITTVVGSSLSPVVCRRDHELFTLFVFVYIVTGVRGTDHPLYMFRPYCMVESCKLLLT